MKLQIVFKTPDAVESAIEQEYRYKHPTCGNRQCGDEGAPESCDACCLAVGTQEEEKQQFLDLAEQYVKYGELITVELDTTTGTCTVLKVKS